MHVHLYVAICLTMSFTVYKTETVLRELLHVTIRSVQTFGCQGPQNMMTLFFWSKYKKQLNILIYRLIILCEKNTKCAIKEN